MRCSKNFFSDFVALDLTIYPFKKRVAAELTKDSDDGKTYYVQVGAFKSKANAEKYLETVKKDYPNAFIKTM